jgi:hypothetical protein
MQGIQRRMDGLVSVGEGIHQHFDQAMSLRARIIISTTTRGIESGNNTYPNLNGPYYDAFVLARARQ